MAGAIVMRAFGGPEVLAWENTVVPPLTAGDVRIRTIAAAVNHSDLEIRTGAWRIRRAEPLPYVPGLEVIGRVVEVGTDVTDLRVGDLAITMMQGLGGVRSERAGGYQELVTVAGSAVAILPGEADALAWAALGLAAVTAHQAIVALGAIAGTRVAVLGASGGVGSAACALAAARGARVCAVTRAPSTDGYLRALGVTDVVRDASQLAPGTLAGIVDTVAGPAFEPALTALADGGRYCMVGAMAGDRVSFSAWELLRAITITGYSSESLDGLRLRAAIADILAAKVAPPTYATVPLRHAADAHRRYSEGNVRGRILLVP